MRKFILPLFFIGARLVLGQTNAQISYVTVAPTGACQSRSNLRLRTPDGTLYSCQSGMWGLMTGGTGTVTSVSGTTNEIAVATGTTTPVISIPAAFDISGKTSTAPIKKGTSLPATCTVGQLFDKTDATNTAVLYACTATNTWTQQTGTGALPAGSLGCVQEYATSSTFLCANSVTSGTAMGVTGTNILAAAPADTRLIDDLFTLAPAADSGNVIGHRLELTDAGAAHEFTYAYGNLTRIRREHAIATDPGAVFVNYADAYLDVGGAGLFYAAAWDSFLEIDGGTVGTLTHVHLEPLDVESGATVTQGAGIWQDTPFNGGAWATYYGSYQADIGDTTSAATITNRYYSWFDSAGVLRTKEDSSFNGVGQAITALYDPQDTKYTPGAPNYSRLIMGEWNNHIAEIGTYAGGTGTVRDLRLLGPTIRMGTASNISSTTFAGAGLDDGVYNGTYTGATLTYCAIIDGTGTPDTFKWGTNAGCDNGATTVAITGANQTLSSGAVIKFAATTGHTSADKWTATMTAATSLWQFQSATYDTLSPKSTASAVAPGAGNAAFRWLAGTNAGTCKLVGNAGTSATEVTIVDNVGGGC